MPENTKEQLEQEVQWLERKLENILKITDLQLNKLQLLDAIIVQINNYLEESGMIIKGDQMHTIIRKAVEMKENGKPSKGR